MELIQLDVQNALEAIDDACLKCKKCCDTCYLAVAKRAITVLHKSENQEEGM